ncbi:MAG: protein kinase [Terriglobales bacterium]
MAEPERLRRVEELYHSALRIAADQRTGFLKNACQGDAKLYQEVESLLAYESSAEEFMGTPAFEVAAKLMAVDEASENQADPVPIGVTLQRFRILEKLGGGGMGVVYKAEDTRLFRTVALKFLPKQLARDPASLERFEREARAASALNHSNICTVYDVSDYEGQPFIAMELLEGQTLDHRIGGRALPLGECLTIGIEILEGLLAAHQKGIIHRDIKPANIFVTSQGQAKILDFGLAKLASAVTAGGEELEQGSREGRGVGATPRATAPLPTPDLVLSRTGVAMGTAGYMSPEQVRGEKLDARTDLFSFGLVLYEMATGHRAFEGDTGPALHSAILTQTPVPARQLNPNIPAKLGLIISKAVEKNREARYQTASEMRSDLEALKQEIELKRPARWREVAVGVVLVGMIASATLWFAERQSSSLQALPDLKLRQLTTNSTENPVITGTISPDGRYLAYSDPKGIYVKLIQTGETKAIPQPNVFKEGKVDWEISWWFPDGKRFLANAHPPGEDPTKWSSRRTSIWAVPILNGVPRKLRDEAFVYSISRDGSTIAFGTNKGRFGDRDVWLMQSDGDQARKLYETGENSAICCVQFSPTGESVAYVTTDDSGDTLVSRKLNDGPVTTLLPTSVTSATTDSLWLPDGRLIYSLREPQAVGSSSCNYWVMRVDARTGEPSEKPRRLTNWGGSCMDSTSVTADAKTLTFKKWTDGATVYVADLDAGGSRIINPRHFTLDEGFDQPLDWTADGKALLFASNRGGEFGIYKQSLNEDTPKVIFAGTANDRETRVSPDGKWVISMVLPKSGGPSEQEKIMRVPITGGAPELIFSTQAHSVHISCARLPSNICVVAETTEDRKQVTITSFDPVKGRGGELTRFDLDPDMNGNGWLCDVSPDGTRLALSRRPEGPIRILSLRGQPAQVIRVKGLDRMMDVYWAADGKGLYVSNGLNGGTLSHVDLQGHAHVLWESHGGVPTFGIPSRDGRHLAIQGSTLSTNIWMLENF